MFHLTEDQNRLSIFHETKEFGLTLMPNFGAAVDQLILPGWGNVLRPVPSTYFQEGYIFEGAWLMPFPNRIDRGKYTFQGKDYQLEKSPLDTENAMHGFVFDRPFTLEGKDLFEGSAILSFSTKVGEEQGYPFPFKAEIKFQISIATGFAAEMSITNLGTAAMPVGMGWHPYFEIRERIDGLKLQLPSSRRMVVNDSKIPTGDLESYDHFKTLQTIGDTKLDHCFPIDQADDTLPEVILAHPQRGQLRMNLNPPLNYLQVYTLEDREAIAIEPMTCAPDAYNNDLGLRILQPQEKLRSLFSIQTFANE